MQDGILLNQISGGHAHGYLGALKGLIPELVENVDLSTVRSMRSMATSAAWAW
jgi:hypothetical protein